MDIGKKLIPINQKNSIKEAVIRLFLAQDIIKPEDFKELIKTNFKSLFTEFNSINSFKLAFENTGGNIEHRQHEEKNMGFQFIGFDEEGSLKKVLQAHNGGHDKTLTSISFHLLKYERWKPFVNEFYQLIQSLNDFRSNIYINAFGLQYTDDFNWIGENIPLDKIFSKNSEIIPERFFKSDDNLLILVNNDKGYFDRIEIRVEPEPIILENNQKIPSIRIIHNITQPLDLISLDEFIGKGKYKSKLDKIHEQNKKLLKDILQPQVAELIGLK
jgi:uncharacterized protein (TIGR04255 family)